MNFLTQLRDDTLKTQNKYSAKRITAFAAFVFSCTLAITALFQEGLTDPVAITIGEFLTASLLALGISSWQKVRFRECSFSTSLSNEENQDPPCPLCSNDTANGVQDSSATR